MVCHATYRAFSVRRAELDPECPYVSACSALSEQSDPSIWSSVRVLAAFPSLAVWTQSIQPYPSRGESGPDFYGTSESSGRRIRSLCAPSLQWLFSYQPVLSSLPVPPFPSRVIRSQSTSILLSGSSVRVTAAIRLFRAEWFGVRSTVILLSAGVGAPLSSYPVHLCALRHSYLSRTRVSLSTHL